MSRLLVGLPLEDQVYMPQSRLLTAESKGARTVPLTLYTLWLSINEVRLHAENSAASRAPKRSLATAAITKAPTPTFRATRLCKIDVA